MNENANIKNKISKLEQERAESRLKEDVKVREDSRSNSIRSSGSTSELGDAMQLKQANTQLQKRIEFLQKREKDLLDHLLKLQKEKNGNKE